ncbi:MAG TPA: hypothetical protein VL523_05220 [Terriglobia bacterium]|nr:hypothetical protein [Terriglobia bacterium]
MKSSKTVTAILACFAVTALAFGAGQNTPGMGMQHMPGMQHMAMKKAGNVRLSVSDDQALHLVTLRLGPLDLPARAGMNVAQAPDLYWNVPIDGWFTGYLASLEGATGQRISARLLHHVAVYDTSRPNFLCPNQAEHIFGAGGELTEWPSLTGLGYRVHRGDRIMVSTMFHNDGTVAYSAIYLKISVSYRPWTKGGPQLMSVYPAWFDVMGCGSSGYGLKPGRSVKDGEFKLPFSGRLIGVGGHMHDYGQELILSNATHRRQIADLKAQLDPQGRLISIPIVRFTEGGGLSLEKADVIHVTCVYDNLSGKYLPDGAMGIMVGYFLPGDQAEFAALRRPAAPAGGAHHP